MPSYSTTLVPLACRYPIDICNSTPSKGKYVLISHKGIEATPHIQYGLSVKMLKGTALLKYRSSTYRIIQYVHRVRNISFSISITYSQRWTDRYPYYLLIAKCWPSLTHTALVLWPPPC